MTFKNKFLNDIKKAYDVYQTTLKGLDIQSQALYERYSTKVANEKNEEIKAQRISAKDKYMTLIEDSYKSALKPLQDIYDKALSGGAITDDVKLFTTKGLYLSRDEVQSLANRYKDNYIMNRLIKQYVEDNNIPMVVIGSTSPLGTEKLEALENAKEYAMNLCDNPLYFNIILDSGFPKIDKIIEG